MLPPVLEIYVVWHPKDTAGREAAEQFVQHFHGSTFSGLIGGAIEIYTRCEGWISPDGAPRPIPLPDDPPPNGVAQAEITAVVPVLGVELARAVQEGGAWLEYLTTIADAAAAHSDRVGIFPIQLEPNATDGTKLGELFRQQRIAAPAVGSPTESVAGLRCRDLAQGIAQLSLPGRLTVFISHTKWSSSEDEEDVVGLVNQVLSVIASTRLRDFFDARDLQPGRDWDSDLRDNAATGAMLALRTDLYATREWCQREMSIAKRNGLPVVILDSLGFGEERGSYLLDHVGRIPVARSGSEWSRSGILRCLNLLVDESLKRELWRRQRLLAEGIGELEVAWWAPHAPELMTLIEWIADRRATGTMPPENQPLRILHPDPPLGPEEVLVLQQLLRVAGVVNPLEVMTPRLLAARGF